MNSMTVEPTDQSMDEQAYMTSLNKQPKFQEIFEKVKSDLIKILISVTIFHIGIAITGVILMQNHSIRSISLFFVSLIISESAMSLIELLIIILLKKNEFKQIKNNGIVNLSDLLSPRYLLNKILQEFVIIGYCYAIYFIIQQGIIIYAIYLQIDSILFIILYLVFDKFDISILIIIIITVIKVVILIVNQITNKFRTTINFALYLTKFRIKIHNRVKKVCTICQQELKYQDQANNLPCDKEHIFHYKCIEKWLQVNNQCPICRKAPVYL